MIAGTASAATTTTVNESSLSSTPGAGWYVYTDNGASGAFVNGPGTPPLGTGSFEFNVPTNGKTTLTNYGVARDPLSGVDTVGYSTYRNSISTMPGYVAPSLNMEICAGGIVADACDHYTTLVWEPVYAYGTAVNGNNPVVPDTWQNWNALSATSTSYTGGWWSTHDLDGSTLGGAGTLCSFNCFVSLDTIKAIAPNAVILSFGVNVGHGPAGSFYGNADALTLGVSGNTTVWNFEHLVTLAGQDECKDGGWMTSSDPTFVNQGDCVSYFASGGKTHSHA
jgi:hypothetical protein